MDKSKEDTDAIQETLNKEELENKINELQTALENKSSTIQALESRLESLSEDNSNLSSTKTNLEKDKSSLEERIRQLSDSENELRKINEIINQRLDEKRDQWQKAASEASRLQTEEFKRNLEIERMKNEVSTLTVREL
ncbi:uncharacterized protein BX663DRAFT_229735 [Cokeromyces recurvatus]|uniref:uncharacterized protein n=1 Tax=Cokeromyces recurvatus TaxID=90255 RepID=UPI00221E41D2|nr:uncharacterized protein BX663DRAFT_229735 [Cokeromyces recurvatus]KAI7898763.1 hypothetical protein BX663DRAFT_229735 [Cokeromyces recurvatus]